MFRKLFGLLLPLVILSTLVLGCQPIQPISAEPVDTEAAEAEFLETVMAKEAAFADGDAQRLAEFYAEDAVSYPPGFGTAEGREAIESELTAFFDAYELTDREFNLVSYEVSGDTAIRVGEWSETYAPRDGSEPFTDTGRCMLRWEKIDGEWQITWELWNTYE